MEINNNYSEEIRILFKELQRIIKESVSVELEEKVWANLPSYYNGERFIRLIPFKHHINIEAKAIKDYLSELTNYSITPTGMLKIDIKQQIPIEPLRKIFRDTLLLNNKKPLIEQLSVTDYSMWSSEEKEFIIAFNDKLNTLGYTCNDEIVDGICYGKYMMIYRKQNVKSNKVYARIYFRSNGIVLRLFLNDIDKHSKYISLSKECIKKAFIGDYGKCDYCKGDTCKFRKSYSIDNVLYDKCNGLTFEFSDLKLEDLNEYISLFKEFYK